MPQLARAQRADVEMVRGRRSEGYQLPVVKYRHRERHMISTSGSGQMMPLLMNEVLQQSMKAGGFDLDFEVVEWGAMLLGYRSAPDAPA
jgi:hypothetical protein